MNILKLVKWAIGVLVFSLRTPFIDFKIEVLDQATAARIAQSIKDGSITDEELADLLEVIRVGF